MLLFLVFYNLQNFLSLSSIKDTLFLELVSIISDYFLVSFSHQKLSVFKADKGLY